MVSRFYSNYKQFIIGLGIAVLLFTVSVIPALLGLVETYTLSRLAFSIRVVFIVIMLMLPAIIAIKLFLSQCNKSNITKKSIILLFPALFSMLALGIFSDWLITLYRVASIESEERIAFMRSMTSIMKHDDDFSVYDYEKVLEKRKDFYKSIEGKEKYLELVAPLVRFCSTGSFFMPNKSEEQSAEKETEFNADDWVEVK